MPNILGSIQKTFSGTSLVAQMAETSAYNAGNLGLIPGLGRSPGEGNGSLLQYCCLENTMDRGAWQAAVHGVAKSWTRLSNFTHFIRKTKGHKFERSWRCCN